ncbi:MAG: alpha-1,3/4-fucosidase, partial [Bacteroidales bacterium]|nr:alpha-1,3/4-fucosidase [Bacteroidales bacterium]
MKGSKDLWLSKILYLVLLTVLAYAGGGCAGRAGHTGIVLTSGSDSAGIILEAARLAPHPRQMKWQEREFALFIHFGMNTFTGREWGERGTPPELFNPTKLDAGQWAEAAVKCGAGML